MSFKTLAGAAVVTFGLLVSMAGPSLAIEDEIDKGIFKHIYVPDTRRMNYEPVPLKNIIDNPKHYFNSYVTLKCRFHRLEEDLTVPEFTPFNSSVHLAFSVWDITANLWDRAEMTSDYPMFFVDRTTDESQKLLRAKRFDVILIYARVETLFDGMPWFQVTDIKFLEKNQLNITLFTHIKLAEDMAAKGQHDLAVEELRRTLQYDANNELRAILYKRLGKSYMEIGKYSEASDALESSYSAKSGDYEVYTLWGDASMNLGKYSQAVNFYNLSLKYLGKQADVYAKIGYCYAKLADEKINSIRSGSTVRKEKKPEEVRRRDKQTRLEFTPAKTGQYAVERKHLTMAAKDEIIGLYEQGIRECRKALFIDPNLPDDVNHLNDITSKKTQFIAWIEKEFGAQEAAPPPTDTPEKGQ